MGFSWLQGPCVQALQGRPQKAVTHSSSNVGEGSHTQARGALVGLGRETRDQLRGEEGCRVTQPPSTSCLGCRQVGRGQVEVSGDVAKDQGGRVVWVIPERRRRRRLLPWALRGSAQTPACGHSPGLPEGNSKACACLQSSALGVAWSLVNRVSGCSIFCQ